MKLKVMEADWDEIFIDTVRIPGDYRKHPSGEKIKNGSVVRISHNGQTAYALARGLRGRSSERVIYMDEFIRDRLGLKLSAAAEIESQQIRAAGFFEHLWFYLRASNPAVRVPAYVAVISLGLGVLSVALGGWSICLAYMGNGRIG